MIPVNDEYVDLVAKAISRNRMQQGVSDVLLDMTGTSLSQSETLSQSFDYLFDLVWNGSDPQDEIQKNEYRNDARAAIAALNLKLLMSP